jgi:dethiobiotin synthetase
MRTLFVTGTDTGVGKTRVACALLAAFAARGLRVAGMKPVAAGAMETPEGLRNEDAVALISASTGRPPYPTVNPYVFAAPVAPHIAAADAGVAISIETITACHAELATGNDIVIVEGAGGLLVPLGESNTFADLALRLEAPVILVVGLRLGCLNHALLTVEALANRGLRLAGWIGSALDPDFARSDENRAYLRRHISAPCWGTLPHRPRADARTDAADLDPASIHHSCAG